MYIELLKKLYYQERKKLEETGVYKQEAKFRLLQLKKSILSRVESRLTSTEILGRTDIAEEVKDNLLRENQNEDKFKKHLENTIDKELTDVENEEKEELRNMRYSPGEFADYLFQLEKVAALEDAISEVRLFPEDVFAEQEPFNEKKHGSQEP